MLEMRYLLQMEILIAVYVQHQMHILFYLKFNYLSYHQNLFMNYQFFIVKFTNVNLDSQSNFVIHLFFFNQAAHYFIVKYFGIQYCRIQSSWSHKLFK